MTSGHSLSEQSGDPPYRLYGHAYALLSHLYRSEQKHGSQVVALPVILEEGHRAPELLDAGLLEEHPPRQPGASPRVSLTSGGRREAEKGHPGRGGRDVGDS